MMRATKTEYTSTGFSYSIFLTMLSTTASTIAAADTSQNAFLGQYLHHCLFEIQF